MTKTRIAGLVAGAALVFGFAFPAAAQTVTVASLQAQIQALMAQLSTMQGGSSVNGVTFNTNLTVGSRGTDVTALQNWLISKGFPISAGATGYFGTQTKAAVSAWQSSANISPAAGYFGPISRGVVNGMGGGTTTGSTGGTVVNCPAGYTCTSTTGGTTTGSTATGSITTPGAEGILTATIGPISSNTVYAGGMRTPIVAFQAKALSSDIALQRVQVDLGTNTTIYNKIFSTLYVVDDQGHVLASTPLNSTTVAKSGSNYLATITGFSSVIPMNMTRTYTIAADLYGAIDSAYRTAYTIGVSANGIRGVDGAGIDLYAGSGGPLPTAETISNAVTVSANLSDSASLSMSADSNTPLTAEVVAADGASTNSKLKVPLLTFDLTAQSDDVTVTDLTTTTTQTGGVASASSTYLYAGVGTSGTLINSASAVTATGIATFASINQVIPKGTTRAFTLAVDVQGATSVQTAFAISVTTVTAMSSTGTTVTATGSASSNSTFVRNIGPVFTLASTPTVVKSSTPLQGNYSTSTLNSTFVVNIQAVGGDIYFGTQAASSTFGTRMYKGGTVDSQVVSSTTSFVIPTSGVVTSGLISTDAFKLSQNNSTQVTVSVYTEGRLSATGAAVTGGSYNVALDNINWTTDDYTQKVSRFMTGKTNWQTPSIQLP